jgi:hypothetical protein
VLQAVQGENWNGCKTRSADSPTVLGMLSSACLQFVLGAPNSSPMAVEANFLSVQVAATPTADQTTFQGVTGALGAVKAAIRTSNPFSQKSSMRRPVAVVSPVCRGIIAFGPPRSPRRDPKDFEENR